jgi:hypothetical protein
MVLLQISASVAEDSAAMGDTIHVTSRPRQLPVKQRDFGLPTEETDEVSRRWDHGPPVAAAANLAELSPSSTARSRPTARGFQAKRAKRPGERSEQLWTHGDNRRWPQTKGEAPTRRYHVQAVARLPNGLEMCLALTLRYR